MSRRWCASDEVRREAATSGLLSVWRGVLLPGAKFGGYDQHTFINPNRQTLALLNPIGIYKAFVIL